MTTAFVLSGGASLGSIQVGMLLALEEAGIQPNLIVGASVGLPTTPEARSARHLPTRNARVAHMDEVTVERTFEQRPDKLWPTLRDLDRWLEPGVRWKIDERATRPKELLVARFWEQPGSSSLITLKIEQSNDGGSRVTITEQLDRHFQIDATLSTSNTLITRTTTGTTGYGATALAGA